MKTLLEGAALLGKFILQNRAKLLLGLGALAIGGAAAFVLNQKKRHEALEEAEAKSASRGEKNKEAPFQKRNKREIFRAPQIAGENLVPH